MSEKKNLKPFPPKPFTRRLAQRISALEGLHMSAEMKSRFAEFDAQKLTGTERRVQLLAQFKNT